jgi:hypothetical protein
MDTARHDDIKTTRKILISEVLLVAAFIGLANFSSFISTLLVAVVVLSFAINIAWAVHLLTNRPPGYGLYALLMLLAGVAIPVSIILYLISGITC